MLKANIGLIYFSFIFYLITFKLSNKKDNYVTNHPFAHQLYFHLMLSPKDLCQYPLALLQEFRSVDFIHRTANSKLFHQMFIISLFTRARLLTYQVFLFFQLPFLQPPSVSVPYFTSKVEFWPIVLLCPVDEFLCTIAEVST